MPEAEKSLDWRTCCWFAADVTVTIFVEKINLSRFPSLELNSFSCKFYEKKLFFQPIWRPRNVVVYQVLMLKKLLGPVVQRPMICANQGLF